MGIAGHLMTEGFGRGHRAEIAHELQAALERRGKDLLPGKAREIVDERIRSVARSMRLTEPSAMRYLPEGWVEQTALALVVDLEAPKLEEQMIDGSSEVSIAQVGRLIEGLAVVVAEVMWRASDGQISVAIGEPLDRLSSLARSLSEEDALIPVDRADLLTTARHLSQLADYLGAGNRHSADAEVDGQSLARKLHQDATAARSSAGR